GSLLLGLHDDHGALHHVGVTSSFTMAIRRQLVLELEHKLSSNRHRERRGHAHVVERSEEHTSELQSRRDLVCRLLLEKKNRNVGVERVGWVMWSRVAVERECARGVV